MRRPAPDPYPVQPVVVRSALPAELRRAITAALLARHADPLGARVLAEAGVRRFAPVEPGDYDFERALLGRVGGAYAGAACARGPGSP